VIQETIDEHVRTYPLDTKRSVADRHVDATKRDGGIARIRPFDGDISFPAECEGQEPPVVLLDPIDDPFGSSGEAANPHWPLAITRTPKPKFC